MPELGMSEGLFADDIREKTNNGKRMIFRDTVEDTLAEHGVISVGIGSESVILNREDASKDVVEGIEYEKLSGYKAKKYFYNQRILSTLFQHNFPHFYAAFGADNNSEKLTGTVREKIYQGDPKAVKYPFKDVIDSSVEMGLVFYYDPTDINFKVGEDGGEYYLDKIPEIDLKRTDVGKIEEFMKSHNYSDADIDTVKMALNRLKTLKDEDDITS